jgi:hypothetical protein
MLRKMAIALVAASVFTAPVLAQNNPLSGGTANKNQPSTSTPSSDSADKTEKTEKSAEAVEKTGKAGKHHHAARHHKAKAAKLGKAGTTMGKLHGAKTGKFAKTEHHAGHGRIVTKHVFGKATKHMPSTTGMGSH